MIGIIWALSLASIPWVLGQACIPPPGVSVYFVKVRPNDDWFFFPALLLSAGGCTRIAFEQPTGQPIQYLLRVRLLLFCCLALTDIVSCRYGSLTQRVGRTECVYVRPPPLYYVSIVSDRLVNPQSTLNGVGSGSTSPSCPPQAPINSIYPGLCPFTAQIQPYDSAAKCVDVRDDNQSDGTPVQM